jgi:hypothetical protein
MTTATLERPAPSKWAKDYHQFQQNPPSDGEVLRPVGSGELARLDVELIEGKPPFIYGKVYLPSIVGATLGWYLQAVQPEGSEEPVNDSRGSLGLKCILLPKARDELIRMKGLDSLIMGVKALRVVRQSRSKKSLLVEIAEY